MSDTAQHSELGRGVQAEALSHPREEVGKTEMSSLHSLGYTGTSTGERKRSDTVWSERYVGIRVTEVGMRAKNILSA
jgi:hypothetical protein